MSGVSVGGHEPRHPTYVDWLTPPHVFESLNLSFDLDPAASVNGTDHVPAGHHYTSNGLERDWFGIVWMNPPYGDDVGAWVSRFVEHGKGVALLFNRSDTRWWQDLVPRCDCVCFVRGRLKFLRGDGVGTLGNAGAPSILLGMGDSGAMAVEECGLGPTWWPNQ